ncbi:MAG TPA: spore coat protein [Bacillota bacterium]|nr:spore coat protein [Bacillota bacterium]
MAILDNLFSERVGSDLNGVLAFNSMAAAATSANAYLIATLQSTTPEVRRLFGEYLTQSIMAHEGLTNLALKKGWINPYDSVDNQLKMVYQEAESLLNAEQAQT